MKSPLTKKYNLTKEPDSSTTKKSYSRPWAQNSRKSKESDPALTGYDPISPLKVTEEKPKY